MPLIILAAHDAAIYATRSDNVASGISRAAAADVAIAAVISVDSTWLHRAAFSLGAAGARSPSDVGGGSILHAQRNTDFLWSHKRAVVNVALKVFDTVT
mmetsp:Transcript_7550/g.16567  ORF Transcript_7550/g.16567 Transcript_7550/m.16567 type:complete len:99 (-) Transcript_7550:177-473(-)